MTGRGILILSPFFSPNMGGVETHLSDLCDYLDRRGNSVYVFTFQPLTTRARAPSFEESDNLEIRRMKWFGNGLFNRLESSFLIEFLYLTPALFIFSLPHAFGIRKRISVIHCHGLNAALVGILLSKIFQKRCVVSIHAIYNLDRRPVLSRLMRVVLSECDQVLALAKKSKLELVGAGVDECKVRVFTYWIDQRNFAPRDKTECKNALQLSKRFVVLFVGRLLEIKGVRTLLETAEKLSNQHDIVFLVVGDGPCREEVKRAARMLPNVMYIGPVQNKELSVYYNAANLVAVPSLYEEGYGRVILEALSCGTPVVASARGGIPEALDPSVGLLIEPTAESFAHAILHLYKNRSDLERMAHNCRPYAEANFNENNALVIANAYS